MQAFREEMRRNWKRTGLGEFSISFVCFELSWHPVLIIIKTQTGLEIRKYCKKPTAGENLYFIFKPYIAISYPYINGYDIPAKPV